MASDLISREALLAEYDRVHVGEPGGARKLIAEAPAVDAVEVVRCGECVNHDQCTFEDTFKLVRITDGYCRVGKRKEKKDAVD